MESTDHDILIGIRSEMTELTRQFRMHLEEHADEREEWRRRIWQVAIGGITLTGSLSLVVGLLLRAFKV